MVGFGCACGLWFTWVSGCLVVCGFMVGVGCLSLGFVEVR